MERFQCWFFADVCHLWGSESDLAVTPPSTLKPFLLPCSLQFPNVTIATNHLRGLIEQNNNDLSGGGNVSGACHTRIDMLNFWIMNAGLRNHPKPQTQWLRQRLWVFNSTLHKKSAWIALNSPMPLTSFYKRHQLLTKRSCIVTILHRVLDWMCDSECWHSQTTLLKELSKLEPSVDSWHQVAFVQIEG